MIGNSLARPIRAFHTLLVIALGFIATPTHAALTFELRTGNNFTSAQSMIIDSNQCPSKGPIAMYVGGVITNTGASAVNNIAASISGLDTNVYLTGGQVASQAIGTLGAGESIGVYWLTGYGCTDFASAIANVQLSSSLGSSSRLLTLTIRKAISASAGGQVLSSTLGPGAVVGQTVYFDANYDFGGTAAGDEYFLQPAGGQSFNAACFRLVGSEIISSNVNAAPVGTRDKLYFIQPNSQTGNGYRISVRYSFQYQCASTSTVARPYAVQTSGNTNVKYTGNYDGTGSISVSYPGATNPFTIAKTVSSTYAYVGATTALTYTVTISNPSSQPSVIAKIVDVLPTGVAFQALDPASAVTAANSSSVPTAGATGTLTFLGKLGISYAIPAGGSVVLKYTATRPSGAGSFTNTAQAYFGSATTPVAQATFQQVTPLSLAVTKVSAAFSDPVNGTVNPKEIPGSIINYTITLTNPNPLPVDSNSVIVTDRTPNYTKMCLTDLAASNSGPVRFTDGSPTSGLSYAFLGLNRNDDALEFSSDSGTTWTYTPTLDADQCDMAITHFRVRPTGAFAAGGTLTLEARYQVN